MLLALAFALVTQQTPWAQGSGGLALYRMLSASGSAFDSAGATLTLRSDTAPPSAFGTIRAILPAVPYRGQQVILSADIETHEVTGGASVWLRVDGPAGVIALDNGMANALKGTSTGHREAKLSVPPDATEVIFGLLLNGSGEATTRALRITLRPMPSSTAPLAPEAKRLLDSAFTLVRTHSLWRDTVTWAEVEPRVRAMAAGAQVPADVYPAIRALLSSLGDHHSFLLEPAGTKQFTGGGAENKRPSARALGDSIGYISVPAYSGADPTAAKTYVTDVYGTFAKVQAQTSCRWVVDLRDNGGGNMWPMLAALRPLLGEAGLGSFVTTQGAGGSWHARDGADLPVPRALAGLDSAYVAVLTGPRTASSGEAVTIAFVGRPRTRSFGQATAGLSTANGTLPLPDGSTLVLTVSVQADRTGRAYGGTVSPDDTVTPDAAAGDAPLARATAWLRSQPRCVQ